MLLAADPPLLNQPLLVTVGLVVAAGRAAKARGPTRLYQIGPTVLIGAETLEKGWQIPRQVVCYTFVNARGVFRRPAMAPGERGGNLLCVPTETHS